MRCVDQLTDSIQIAWQKAQDAWEAAGKPTPCHEAKYMAARKELADLHARRQRQHARR